MSEALQIKRALFKDEVILWQGKPRLGIVFRQNDWLFVPFSIAWTSVAFHFEYSNLSTSGSAFMSLFDLVFVIIGIYLTAGRFLVDAVIRRNTDYALTNRRAIVATSAFGIGNTSVDIRNTSNISMIEMQNGSGSIMFGSEPWNYAYWDGVHIPGFKRVPRFEMIKEVLEVYAQIMHIKSGTNTPSPNAV